MATTEHEIQVLAMFPREDQSSEWNWVHCLTFPLDSLRRLQFTPKPYKWIPYATGVVVGAQGSLKFSSSSSEGDMDYNLDLPSESIDLFYHTSEAERQRMFPADPDMNRTSVSSDITSRRAQFRSDVVERDGACVLTGLLESHCDAAHLLPHTKGDGYIQTYTERRSRGDGHDIVGEIDDVRNGILLNPISHRSFGKNIGFLVTPNFAMSTTDVDSTASETEKRCTAHLFLSNHPQLLGASGIRSGARVQMPDPGDDWPPDILFDAVYASAVLHHFGVQALQDAMKPWKSLFYPGGITSSLQAGHQSIANQRTVEDKKKDKRAAKRARRANDSCIDYFDCLMIMSYMHIPPARLESTWREAEAERAEMERNRLADKVTSWAKEVAESCS